MSSCRGSSKGLPSSNELYSRESQYDIIDFVCDRRRSRRLFKRCDTPALPIKNSLYSQAKRLEYNGDIAGALDMFYKAMLADDRVDSCLKDIAGLLNMLGRTTEAVEFLRSHVDKVHNYQGFNNLLSRLELELAKESSSDLPRGVSVTVVDRALGPVTLALCDRLFPNPAKIRRILHTDKDGFVAAVHFATHSSARKALQVRKVCGEQIVCNWCTLYTDARLRLIERMEGGHNTSIQSIPDEVPAHLKTFGWISSIPIYKEDDESLPCLSDDDFARIHKLATDRAEAAYAKHAIDNVTTPSSIEESTPFSAQVPESLCSPEQTTLTPFVTDVLHPSGKRTRAVIIPLADDHIAENRYDHGSTNGETMFTTPIKASRPTGPHFKTPSPVVEHYLFT